MALFLDVMPKQQASSCVVEGEGLAKNAIATLIQEDYVGRVYRYIVPGSWCLKEL